MARPAGCLCAGLHQESLETAADPALTQTSRPYWTEAGGAGHIAVGGGVICDTGQGLSLGPSSFRSVPSLLSSGEQSPPLRPLTTLPLTARRQLMGDLAVGHGPVSMCLTPGPLITPT